MSDRVKMDRIPPCDFCVYETARRGGLPREAEYDGATVGGPWAYMCQKHFTKFGVGLGTGRGQRLILNNNQEN